MYLPPPRELEVWPVHPVHLSSLFPVRGMGPKPSCPRGGGLTMQQALVRVRTQGWSETPTPENHGLAPQEVSSEACVQLPR